MKNILLPILCCLALLSCDSPKSPESARQDTPQEQSHEGHNHEVMDGHSHEGHSHAAPAMQHDEDTARVQFLIRALSKTYGEPADSIAERTYRARYVLSDFGVEESALQILESMHKPGRKEQPTYREAVLQYTMRRTQGGGGGN